MIREHRKRKKHPVTVQNKYNKAFNDWDSRASEDEPYTEVKGASPTEELEVTKKLSSLKFSVQVDSCKAPLKPHTNSTVPSVLMLPAKANNNNNRKRPKLRRKRLLKSKGQKKRKWTGYISDSSVDNSQKKQRKTECFKKAISLTTKATDIDMVGESSNDEWEDMPVDRCSSESELSETADEQGRDGDDEESSYEAAITIKNKWWENQQQQDNYDSEEMSCSDDEKVFHQVLTGSFQHMSTESKINYKEQVLSEFKVPTRVRIRGIGSTKKKYKHNARAHFNSTNLVDINERIKDFVKHSSHQELRLPLLTKRTCSVVTKLAALYNLQCSTDGGSQLPVASLILTKMATTKLASASEVKLILYPDSQPVIIGGDVPALSETNIGNKMLQGMGWMPGTGLGPHSNGIVNPIVTIRRPKLSGLGFH